MKKYILILLLIIVVGILGVYRNNISKKQIKHPKPETETAIGTKEDPQARLDYEFKRLRDPKTGKIPVNIRKKELAYASTLPIRNQNHSLYKSGEAAEGMFVSGNWKLRGPYNVGGRTRALGIDVNNENIILAGGVSGGMWRSTDGGAHWVTTTDPAQLHSVTCLAQDTRSGHNSTWYFGTGEYRGNTASGDGTNAFFVGDGIFKSNDNGLTWEVLPNTASNSPQTFNIGFDVVWDIAVDPSNTSEAEVYAAVYNRIYRSTNGGDSWTNVLSASNYNNAKYTDVAVSSTGTVYATLSSGETNGQGIFRSTNGTSWTNITPGGWPSTNFHRIVLSIAPSNENIVYFLAETPGYGTNDHSLWKYEYISGDGSGSGGNWTNLKANLPAQGGLTGNFDSQYSYDLLIKVKPDNENTVFIGGTNLYRSTDGFSTKNNITWIGGYDPTDINSAAQYINQHPDQHALVFYPSNNSKVITGHDGGLSVTNNVMASNVSWQKLNNGYYTTQFYTCSIDYSANGDNLIMGGMQDNGTYMINTSLTTANWDDLYSGDGSYCAIGERSGGKYYYVSAQNGQILRLSSADVDYDWARVDPDGGTGYLFIAPFILDRNNSKMMYLAGGSVIWRNTDLTAIDKYNKEPTSLNWTKLTGTQLATALVSALEISTVPANRLYYGTDDGYVFRLDNANTGNPTPVDKTSDSFPGGYISCIAVDPSNADNVIVAFSNYSVISLWYTNNGGSSWQNISGNLEQNPDGSGNGPAINWAEILPTEQGTIYLVGASTGLYSSILLNGASTVWANEGPTSIGNVVVDMIDSRTTDNLVVVATHGNGMYSSNVSVTTAMGPEPGGLVKAFQLKQNFPNPFNPATTIEYSISESSPVTIKVFNIEGKEIATLVNSYHAPGNYSIEWNGMNRFGQPAASGTYIYEIIAGKFHEAKRMILMK